MANFTDDEIQAAVEALVQNTIRRPYDTLGVRRNDVSFTDIQQAAAGVFLLYPKAPFYCMYLGAQALLQVIKQEAQVIDDLLDAIGATGRSVVPITDVTPLFNAKAALDALGQAALERSTNFKDITTVPAYQQFTKNVDRFLDTAGEAVKQDGEIVKTPQEARKGMPALVVALEAAHAKLLARVKLLALGAEDYAGLNLSGIVAQSVISKASAVLDAHATELDVLLPEQRLERVRAVVLDLLAAKSVVTTYGSFGGVTTTHALVGTGAPYADATHLAEPAVLRADLSAPYNLQLGGNVLDLFLDADGIAADRSLVSATSIVPTTGYSATFNVVSVPLDVVPGDVVYPQSGSNAGSKFTIVSIGVGSFVAAGVVLPLADAGPVTLEVRARPSATVALPYAFSPVLFGTRQEFSFVAGNGYIIGDGVSPIRDGSGAVAPNNNVVIFTINGVSYPVTLTLSADGDGISIDATPRTAIQVCADINAVLNPVNYVAEPYLNPRKYLGSVIQTIDAGTSAFFDLVGGFGDFGALAIQVGEIINLIDGDVTQQGLWTITAVAATRLTATNNLATPAIAQTRVTMEVGAVLRSIKVRAVDPSLAVDSLDELGVTYLTDTSSPSFNGAVSIGMTPGAVSRARKQTAKELVTAIQGASSLLKAQATMAPSLTGVAARSEPTGAARITFSKLRGTATTVWDGSVLTATISGALTAEVEVGDKLVERGGNYIGTLYTVTGVTDTAVTATSVSGTPSSQTGVTIELGKTPGLSSYDLIRVETGPNAGDYYVSSVSGLDISLLSVLPLNANPADGTALTFTVSVGPEYLEVLSAAKTTASFVMARGNAELEFFTHGPGQAGTTKYFQLPSKVRALAVNDLLLFFATQYNEPSAMYTITAIESDVLTLDEALPSNVSWAFSPTAVVPFAKLEAGAAFDFDLFKLQLDGWTGSDTQDEAFFIDLNRFINPLIANNSPTGVAIGDAQNKVHDLAAELTLAGSELWGDGTPLEVILGTLTVEHQPAVDAMLRAFREKGADRAIDILTGGQFQAFFALDKDDASYAGAMQKAMRDVVMNDLSIKKTDRKDTKVSRLLATTQDTDPDFDLSDTENAVPDPVGQGDY